MSYDREYRRHSVCSNCGRSGHEFRVCRDPRTSFGLINVDIVEGNMTDLVITGQENRSLIETFSSGTKKYCRIFSQKYPEIDCFVPENASSFGGDRVRRPVKISHLDPRIRCRETEDRKRFQHYHDRILFMMVSRRYSLGFIEFLRGKYHISDSLAIVRLFEQMYSQEIEMIRTTPYDDMLYLFSNRKNESKERVLQKLYQGKYSIEYCEAKLKFESLSNPTEEEKEILPATLEFYLTVKPLWEGPEWGFPKGRRENNQEDNMSCACREFQEETGYETEDYAVLNHIDPLEELMEGTNGVTYKHIYYLAINKNRRNTRELSYDRHEIGSVRWFNYEEAMRAIRPYHHRKKQVLDQAFSFVINTIIRSDTHL